MITINKHVFSFLICYYLQVFPLRRWFTCPTVFISIGRDQWRPFRRANMPSSQYSSSMFNLVGRPINTYPCYHSSSDKITHFSKDNFADEYMLILISVERRCAYHGPRAHHNTVDWRYRIWLLIEQRRREEDGRILLQDIYLRRERWTWTWTWKTARTIDRRTL